MSFSRVLLCSLGALLLSACGGQQSADLPLTGSAEKVPDSMIRYITPASVTLKITPRGGIASLNVLVMYYSNLLPVGTPGFQQVVATAASPATVTVPGVAACNAVISNGVTLGGKALPSGTLLQGITVNVSLPSPDGRAAGSGFDMPSGNEMAEIEVVGGTKPLSGLPELVHAAPSGAVNLLINPVLVGCTRP